MSDITMPRLSDTMQEGTIARWLKKAGDEVKKGDTLAEIETDKATMDLEAYEAGILQQVLVQEGETVPLVRPWLVLAAVRGTRRRSREDTSCHSLHLWPILVEMGQVQQMRLRKHPKKLRSRIHVRAVPNRSEWEWKSNQSLSPGPSNG